MNLFIAVSALLILSFLWALWSLKREGKKPREISHVEKELRKEKILFQR